MRIIKRINNNAVLCVDDNGRQAIALGRGLSSIPLSEELSLDSVIHTFYEIDPRYVELMRDLPIEHLTLSAHIADIARGLLPYELNPNIDIALADHIAFAVQRTQKGILLKAPLTYDIQQNYPLEYKIAQYALKLIKSELKVRLPQSETSGIALTIINGALGASDERTGAGSENIRERQLQDITEIVEQSMCVTVDREKFGFARFATHIQYLLSRVEEDNAIETGISSSYEPFVEENPEIAACVDRIAAYIYSSCGHSLSDEEKLYLFLHVNRICNRSEP